MTKWGIFLAVILVAAFQAKSQNKSRQFKLQPNAHYVSGKLLVKTKANYKEEIMQLASSKSGARIKNISLRSLTPVVKPELARQGASRLAPRNPKIDIARYFSISYDPGRNVEEVINELYATGYFEIIEPEYEVHTSFTPNDPNFGSQYYLNTIKALQAWDVTQGDTSVTIAIVDTGGLLTHPDLAPNLYTNWAEYPPNGIDDDGNGFIDDYRGWDFVGADTANLADPNFIGDNDPNNSHSGVLGHATMVAGCASAATNNGIGIAGVGFKSRLMFTKHTADNQSVSQPGIYAGYSGVMYAANLGIKIINCSWGGTDKSAIIQELINHVVLDLGSLVVSAAGNGGNNTPIYPGAYDNVLSVAGTDANNRLASFTTYGNTVDLSAPGVGIFTTDANGYITVDGTSFSSPMTSGAAALVWAQNPGYTATQVAEQLRVASNSSLLYGANSSNYANMLGHGLLDVASALTADWPSLRASNPILSVSGTKTLLSFDFTNYLKNTSSGLEISISVAGSAAATVTKNRISPGAIAGNTTYSNRQDPFELTVSPTVIPNTVVNILISYTDGTYQDSQYIGITLNPSYLDVNANKILTTVSNIGRLGFQDPSTSNMGEGFIFNQQSLLFEMGLIMGTSGTNIYNNVRGLRSGFDQDFFSTVPISEATPGQRSFSEISGAFSNSTTPSQQAVVVNYQSLVWKESPYNKFVILEYKIKNPTANPLSNFYFGIFADWDISPNVDAAKWYAAEKLGYVYDTQDATKAYAGIQVLKGPANYYAIDNAYDSATGHSFGVYGSFTDAQKFTALSTPRYTAGLPLGGDVSHVVSSGPYTVNPGAEVTIAFALHGANNLSDLVSSAQWADSVYNFTLTAPQPTGDSVTACYGSTATLNVGGAANIKWYTQPVGGTSFFSGDQFTTGNLLSDTAFYVSNADHTYESVRTPAVVSLKANPKISSSGGNSICQGSSITLSVAPADSVIWSNGLTTNTITVSDSGTFSVRVVDNTLHCQSISPSVVIKVNSAPVANFVTQGGLNAEAPISFRDESTGATSWSWSFGDGGTSDLQNPQHTFTNGADFDVTLIVTNDLGCQDSRTNSVSVITGLADPGMPSLQIYPNPSLGTTCHIVFLNPTLSEVEISVVNSLGEQTFLQKISSGAGQGEILLPVQSVAAGLYIVRMRHGSGIITKKVILNADSR